MNTLQVKEYNCETGEEIVRDATAEEIAQFEIDKANFAAKAKAQAEKKAAKQALLAKLGITEDEARLLLGGN